ncbi:MAG: glycosyltransferase family 4 protein [Chloroflexi bacterium]|nr:glycosyltransferase family 4 protein [Chloroflexota bacterium]
MRVCILGDASPPHDEGMKKVTWSLATALSARTEVLTLNPLRAATLDFWRQLRRFGPDIVHYVPGPSLKSFLLLAAVKRRTAAYTVLSLTHPDPAMPRRLACRFLQPDLVLTQSAHWEQLFKAAGCRNLQFVPNGVDTARFKPATPDEKRALRQKYELSPDAFIVLHVGNTRTVRQLDVLPRLRQAGCEVIVVSSTTIRGDGEMDDRLTQAGCRIWNHYIEAVEEVYALADCYVFPLAQGVGAIEHPLSVIEAMATNLPVITRRFGALPRTFSPGDGLYFVDLDDEIVHTVQSIRDHRPPVATCEKARALDWERIADRLLELYQATERGQ